MSKQVKRKITVNVSNQKSKAVTKNRPSVFERLGTKAGSAHSKEFCHHWAQNGTCPYGKSCKYSNTHTLISPSKQRAAKKENDKIRHKDGHKRGHGDEGYDWNPAELEDADPDDLEKKRLEIQRELELVKMENKVKKKDKKLKKESSPSSESSSTSSDSSSSSDESSSTSSSSADARKKRTKKLKKRDSSSSSECDRKKHKLKGKRTSKSSTREKIKKMPAKLPPKLTAKSTSPPTKIRKQSQTPPPKIKPVTPATKRQKSESKSPRPTSRSSDRKEKHRTPSPRILKEKEREKEREREQREREREREREKEREKEKEREREREKERERERERAREKAREKEKLELQKKKDSRSPRRDLKPRDTKKRDSPDSTHSRDRNDRKTSPSRSRGSGSSTRREPHRGSPTGKDDRRTERKDDKKDRSTDRKRPEKRDSRERERERDRERERRIAREEREAAREKEREEALARCQERQRERERLKELQKKEEERRQRERRRGGDDRGLDKPASDRVERLLPLPADRVPPARKDGLDRDRGDRGRERDRRDRTPDNRSRAIRKSPDRHERLDRDKEHLDRAYDRTYERDHDRDREYPAMSRLRDDIRDIDKHFESPYERSRHEDMRYMDAGHYSEPTRDERIPMAEYTDERRGRREHWDEIDIDRERERELDHRRYRDDTRSGHMKGRAAEWGEEYPEHEWDRNRRQVDWETRDSWDTRGEHEPMSLDEEWRHYNRSMDSWSNEERRRWAADWRERSRPRSSTSHRDDDTHVAAAAPRKEQLQPPPAARQESIEPKPHEPPVVEPKKETILGKRQSDQPPIEPEPEPKKQCIKEPPPPIEDDFSEISDDADEILDRVEEVSEMVEDIKEEEVKKEMGEEEIEQKIDSPKSVKKEESLDEENAMDLDFEEISEDELEEGTGVKGICDALDVDWASLVAESRPRITPASSAKLRWESHNVLVNLGVSVEMAGEALVADILQEHTQAQLLAEPDQKETVKKEETDENLPNGIKQEIKEEEVEEQEPQEPVKVEISHPIAAIQVANREEAAIRKSLFSSAGLYRRGLSARRDLAIRRHLCNLPIKDSFVEPPKQHDPELFKAAKKLFERGL